MTEEFKEQVDRVCELAEEKGLADRDFLDCYAAVAEALREKFGAADTGVGAGYADFWIPFRGVEYKLVMKPHRTLNESH